jgi:dephospho-CoA kinase
MTAGPIRLGLTGSIGMGKSTVAAMFAKAGVPVWDADAAVHRLYAPGGDAVAPIAAAFPGSVKADAVDRAALAAILTADPDAFARLEAIVHPLVARDRAAFLAAATARGAQLVVFDIPLLFETGAEAAMDATLVVTAPPAVQRARVLSRPGMTEARFALIASRQLPDAEKRRRADHVIESVDLDDTRRAVQHLIARLGNRVEPDA